MDSFWKEHFNNNTNIYQKSLLKQVGKTVNGTEVDKNQILLIEKMINKVLNISSSDVLIDICCGNGILTRYFSNLANIVYGVDFSNNLIDVAKNYNFKNNIVYLKCDVIELPVEFFKKANKFLMYEALQHFTEEMFSVLLNKMSYINKGSIFFVGSIPNIDKLWDYYDTEEKKIFYTERELMGEPHIGKWWNKHEIENIAFKHGFTTKIFEQNSKIYTSYYRFDCLLEKV